MSVSVSVDEKDLKRLMDGLSKLQSQLPTHQVNALRQTGAFVATGMRRRAAVMKYDGVVERSIGSKESHVTVGGIVQGKTATVVVGPGVAAPMPIHAPLVEAGWRQTRMPPFARIERWAFRRGLSVTKRDVWYIARRIVEHGALSPNNPRAGGQSGYFYVQKTYDQEGKAALEALNNEGFQFVASILRSM